MRALAIFASGSGTNAENLIRHFRTGSSASVELVLTNKPGAGVLNRARELEVESVIFDREKFYETGEITALLLEKGIDFVALAGFLWLVPEDLLEAYSGRMVNIHPALLPRHGGKGMYGRRVHEAVLAHGDPESGITIHLVNQHYDEGDIIFQAKCPVFPEDTADTLAARIHELEYLHYPRVVEQLLDQL
jgi:phosphoribosylglycinamide formyltransferase-1